MATRVGAAVARAWAWLSAPCRPRPRDRANAHLREGSLAGARRSPKPDADALSAEQGLTSLARALHHRSSAVRARAVSLVSDLADGGDVLKTMIYDPDATVRLAVARAAARAGTTDGVATLIVALADSDADVRAAAADAVARVTGCRITRTIDDVSAGEIDDVKRWWKEKRFSEVLRSVSPDRALLLKNVSS